MPPPPPVSSTRTEIRFLPPFNTPAGIEYFLCWLYELVSPTFTPFTYVTSLSSIIASSSIASLPASVVETLIVLRNQTTPSRSPSCLCSHNDGSDICGHELSSI